MVPFSRAVSLWRAERGWTQQELALRAGISRPNLSAIERGKREVSLKTLRVLASALGVKPGVLVDGIDPFSARGPFPLSRNALDRIADAAFGKGSVQGSEKELADLLRLMTRSRRAVGGRAGKRRVQTAWLKFKSAFPPEVVQTLLQRMEDRQRLPRSSRGS